jgi:hypothetical protein
MGETLDEELTRIRGMRNGYPIKASVCKFAFMRHEMFEEWEAAEALLKLAIEYQEKMGDFPWNDVELKGLRGHLRTVHRKRVREDRRIKESVALSSEKE